VRTVRQLASTRAQAARLLTVYILLYLIKLILYSIPCSVLGLGHITTTGDEEIERNSKRTPMSSESSETDSSSESISELSSTSVYGLSKSKLIKILLRKISTRELLEVLSVDTLRKQLVTIIKEKRSGQRKSGETTIHSRERDEQGSGESEEEEQQESHNITTITMTAKPSKLEFILGQDDWETYIERMELYFIANEVSETKKVAVLLTKVNAEMYNLVRDLCAPEKPKDKTFEDIIKIVSTHLCPKPSVTMERCKFHTAKQSETEKIADFSARLKKLALHCKFTDLQVALRDQFICGLKDEETKTELFTKETPTFEGAYKFAAAREEAKENATQTAKMISGTTATEDTHAMFVSQRKQGTKHSQYREKQKRRTYAAQAANSKAEKELERKKKAESIRNYAIAVTDRTISQETVNSDSSHATIVDVKDILKRLAD
jgi:hypothetical protein